MKKFNKWAFAVIVIFFTPKAKAQLSSEDSIIFNSAFVHPLYIPYWDYPYKWYTHDSITSMDELNQRMLTIYPFTPADLSNNTYNNIINGNLEYVTDINASFNLFPWIYGQTDPVMKMPFVLNGIHDTAYTAYTPGAANASCKTAFLIIHGNGHNTTSELLQGTGYGSIYCNVKNTCLQYGDVYCYCKPNEDWRATYWNQKKLYEYNYNYCASVGHNGGTNYLIETIALVKHLRAEYCKVIIMGLSEGGYTTLLNLINAEPDAAVISAGYSINFDITASSLAALHNRFGDAPDYFLKDTIKSRISNLETNILFTWGAADPVKLMAPEHDFHYTEHYLDNYSKCSFFYDFADHTFPPCNALDTFVQRIKNKPKPFITLVDSIYYRDSMQIKIAIAGQPPYTFDLYKDGSFFTSLRSDSDTLLYTLKNEGEYQVKNLDDAGSGMGFNSNIVNHTRENLFFKGLAGINENELTWTNTENAAGVYFYVLEHSTDLKKWDSIYYTSSGGKREIKTFSYSDKNNTNEKNYYRISVRYDDKLKYSKHVVLLNPGKMPLAEIYPNPAKELFTVNTNRYDNTVFKLHDMQGKTIFSQILDRPVTDVSIKGIKPGIYQISLSTFNQIFYTGKLMVE